MSNEINTEYLAPGDELVITATGACAIAFTIENCENSQKTIRDAIAHRDQEIASWRERARAAESKLETISELLEVYAAD